MRIEHRPGTAQPAVAQAGFRAGHGWLPLAAGGGQALNPDAWRRQPRLVPAGAAHHPARSLVTLEVPR
ncbi:MAG: hypothetical protein OEW72_07270 [Gammaproteobacteria bacterium]|nr:hypothetical protein [Gammaproteobacteria bacterium]